MALATAMQGTLAITSTTERNAREKPRNNQKASCKEQNRKPDPLLRSRNMLHLSHSIVLTVTTFHLNGRYSKNAHNSVCVNNHSAILYNHYTVRLACGHNHRLLCLHYHRLLLTHSVLLLLHRLLHHRLTLHLLLLHRLLHHRLTLHLLLLHRLLHHGLLLHGLTHYFLLLHGLLHHRLLLHGLLHHRLLLLRQERLLLLHYYGVLAWLLVWVIRHLCVFYNYCWIYLIKKIC